MLEIYNDYPFQSNDDGSISIQSGDVRADDTRNIVMSLEIDAEKPMDASDLVSIDVSFYNLFEKMRLDKASRMVPLVKSATETESDKEVVVERLVTSSAKTVIKAGRLIKENDIGMARTLLQAAIERVEDNIKLSSDVLSPILQRLKNIEIKLRENAATASKHFMAEGTDLYSRMDIIDTGGVDVHDRIFEYKVIGDIDLYKCPDIKATVQAQMRDGYRFVIFDLSDSKFIDSSAIGAFIQIVGWLRKRGGEFIVTNIVDSVRKVFTITRLENHIRVATSMDEARDIVESIISATSR